MIRRSLVSLIESLVASAKPLGRRLFGSTGVYQRVSRYYVLFLMRLLRHRCTVSIGDARATFAVSSESEFRRIRSLGREEHVLRDLLSSLTNEDVFFDIGANIGLHSCLAGSVLSHGAVVAVEPHPGNFELLMRNVEINGDVVDVLQVALSDETGTGEMIEKSDSPGEGRHRLVPTSSPQTISVERVKGDTLVQEGRVSAPTVLKIDVEGAEMQVLRGLIDTLHGGAVRLVYCEVHPQYLVEHGDSAQEIHAFLRECGFSVEELNPGDRREIFLKASRPT